MVENTAFDHWHPPLGRWTMVGFLQRGRPFSHILAHPLFQGWINYRKLKKDIPPFFWVGGSPNNYYFVQPLRILFYMLLSGSSLSMWLGQRSPNRPRTRVLGACQQSYENYLHWHSYLGHQGLHSLRQSDYASFTLGINLNLLPWQHRKVAIAALEITWDNQTSSNNLRYGNQTSSKDIGVEISMFYPIQTHASMIQDSNTCIEVIFTRDRHLSWNAARLVFKNNLVLGSHSTFVWKAVGCTQWMESAMRCSFSWAPSHLGADSMTVTFEGERCVVRLAEWQ
jgi:hypothetical protein